MRTKISLLFPVLSIGLLPGCTGKAVVETENQAPSAPVLSLGPTDARTDDDLVVSIRTEATDPDGDTIVYGYAWFQNGVARGDLTEATVPAAETTKGDVWDVTVTPNDGALDGAATTASITVLNSLPVVTLAFESDAPATEDDLRVIATAEDADGDTVTLAYAWSLEGTATAYTFDTVPADATTRGDRWSVSVTPSDSEGAGLPVTAELTIANSVPEVLAVSLVPEQPYVTDDVVATVEGYDADADAIVYDYRWFVDGTEVQSGPSDTLPAGSFAKHQRISVEVTPNDGVTDGTPFASTDATALNSLPSASSPTIDPATAYEASTLSCIPAGFTDADGDPEGWTYAWSVNGSAAGSTSTLDGAAFDKGDRVTCAATPEDGEESGEAATSAELTISNTAPVLASVDLSTYAPTENDTLSVTIGAVIDDDGDTLGYGYAWYVNGSVAATTSTLASNRFAKNDSIYVVVTPWDGTSYGSPVSSAVATGTNTAPTLTRVTLSPSAVYTSSTITASVTSSDLDGDTVSYSYDWYVDGYPRGSSTSATLSGASYFDKGQVVYVIVTPNDGDADGATSTSSSVTVANTAPTAPVVEITPGDAVDGDDLTCSVVTAGTDADGDALTYTFDWDVDGVAYTGATDGGTSSVVDGGDVGGGETWACEVTADDGTATISATDNTLVFDPEEDLIAYFPMDGDSSDQGPSRYSVTSTAVSYTTDHNGVAGNAASFNGSSSYIRSTTDFSFSSRTALSYMAWMYWDGTGSSAYPTAFRISQLTCGGAEASITSVRTGSSYLGILGRMYSSCVGGADAPASIPSGRWTHVAVIHDGSSTYIYVNGIEVSEDRYEMTHTASAKGFIDIGFGVESDTFFDGSIDEVRIYNRAMDASEIAILFSL